ncbi:MAG: ABC transporter permease, partial [Thermoplasmata archaeon]|nr:ABC transporter permease [Thermoplasmata archaeon]
MKMWIYIVRRLILLVPVIIGVMTITFLVTSALPLQDRLTSAYGTPKVPLQKYVPCNVLGLPGTGLCLNPTYVRDVHSLGLDQPPWVQWGIYVRNSLTLNWGATDSHSLASETLLGTSTLPIVTVLSWYLPYTLELAALSLFLILVISIPLGNYSAVYRNRPLDQGARVISFSGFALPGFLLATILLLAFTSLLSAAVPVACGGTYIP